MLNGIKSTNYLSFIITISIIWITTQILTNVLKTVMAVLRLALIPLVATPVPVAQAITWQGTDMNAMVNTLN